MKLSRDVTSPTIYQKWADGIPWNGADSSPGGDANGDGMPNLMAYGLLLDPRAQAPAGTMPTANPQGNLLDFWCWKNPRDADLTYTVRRSTDLAGRSDLTIDGNLVTETNTGMLGDAQLIRVCIPIARLERKNLLQLSVRQSSNP